MKSLVVLLMLFTVPSRAAFEKGNGGDAITSCKDPNRPKVQFYDLYEAEHRYSLRLVIPDGSTAIEKAENLISRIHRLNPNRAKLYREWLSTFFEETKFITGKSLVDVPDTGAGFIPAGCILEQLIIQVDPSFPKDKRYTINKDLWNQMDIYNQAAAILHELILREASLPENNHITSQPTRYLHAIIESSQMMEETAQSWVEKLMLTHFDRADWGNNPIQLDPVPEFYDENHFKKVYLFRQGHFDSAQIRFDYDCPIERNDSRRVLIPVELHPNGNLKSVEDPVTIPDSSNSVWCFTANLEPLFNSKLKNAVATPAKNLDRVGIGSFLFYDNGVPEYIGSQFRFNPTLEDSRFSYEDIAGVYFWPDGSLKVLAADRYADNVGQFGKIDLKSPQLNGFNYQLIFNEVGDIVQLKLFNKLEYPVLSEKVITEHVYLENTWVKKLVITARQSLTIQSQKIDWNGLDLKVPDKKWTDSVLYLYSSGALRCAKAMSELSLQDENGITQDYYAGMRLMFTESGLVKKIVKSTEECE